MRGARRVLVRAKPSLSRLLPSMRKPEQSRGVDSITMLHFDYGKKKSNHHNLELLFNMISSPKLELENSEKMRG